MNHEAGVYEGLSGFFAVFVGNARALGDTAEDENLGIFGVMSGAVSPTARLCLRPLPGASP